MWCKKQSVAVYLLGALSLVMSAGVWAQPTERVTWDKAPIQIVLPVGQERIVQFPDASVRVGVPSDIANHLRTQSVEGRVYWLASAPFERTRVQVRALPSGPHYLLDVSAVANGGSAVTVVVNPSTPATQNERVTAARSERTRPPRALPFDLTRYAAQRAYAPDHVLTDVDARIPGVRRIALGVTDARALYRAAPGVRIGARALAQWRASGLYVTAVRLENQGSRAVTLSARAFQGRWITIAFHHGSRLGARGADDAVTTAYLVSRRPFADASG